MGSSCTKSPVIKINSGFSGPAAANAGGSNVVLGQMMTDFAGHEGWLRKLAVQYRGMDQPGSKVVCKGKVAKKYAQGRDHMVDCEIWLENAKGEKTTIGSATVILPSREGSRAA